MIAGGGVAALEGMLALRSLLDGMVSIDLIAPTDVFVYRPLSVAEPFGLAEPRRFSLREIAEHQRSHLYRGTVAAVEHEHGRLRLDDGFSLGYDLLLIATGARSCEWLPGAISFAGPADVEALRELIAQIDAGTVSDVVFTTPSPSTWTLPLYELALLSSSHVAERGHGGVRLTVLTPEAEALEVFGPSAAGHVLELFADRGIVLQTATRAVSFERGRLALEPHGEMRADAVVALPRLQGAPIEGVPADRDGFIPVDEHGAVRGLDGVYAAGDSTAYPVKQGGLAAQQADAAAEAIAAALGAAVQPQPYRGELRGQLLTGLMPTYLLARTSTAGPSESTVAFNPLWWPPSKIAGRHLAPYLSGRIYVGEIDELTDRPAGQRKDAARAAAHHETAREIALGFAESDARHGDFRSALGWLRTLEELDGMLPRHLLEKRAEWRLRAVDGVP